MVTEVPSWKDSTGKSHDTRHKALVAEIAIVIAQKNGGAGDASNIALIIADKRADLIRLFRQIDDQDSFNLTRPPFTMMPIPKDIDDQKETTMRQSKSYDREGEWHPTFILCRRLRLRANGPIPESCERVWFTTVERKYLGSGIWAYRRIRPTVADEPGWWANAWRVVMAYIALGLFSLILLATFAAALAFIARHW